MEFVDNGQRMNFERPAVQELLEMVQAGKVDCIIVKDLSRFGRNRLRRIFHRARVSAVSYLVYFRKRSLRHGVIARAIPAGLDVAFKYLISECYSRICP